MNKWQESEAGNRLGQHQLEVCTSAAKVTSSDSDSDSDRYLVQQSLVYQRVHSAGGVYSSSQSDKQ